MNPLVVTAYYDVGRSDWGEMSRSRAMYLASFAQYTARLSPNLYVLCDADVAAALSVAPKYSDVAPLSALKAYEFFGRTRDVMETQGFRALFKTEDDAQHVEHLYPLYNIVTLAKWDALERAFDATKGAYSHYVWADFALGKRAAPKPSLPPFDRFAPIARDKIVISASTGLPPRIDCRSLSECVRTFSDLSSGNVMIVPRALVGPFVSAARRNYQRLLDCGLACDDQLVTDMCLSEHPEMFYLSYQRRSGSNRFSHAHDIVRGVDTETLKSMASRAVLQVIVRARNGLRGMRPRA